MLTKTLSFHWLELKIDILSEYRTLLPNHHQNFPNLDASHLLVRHPEYACHSQCGRTVHFVFQCVIRISWTHMPLYAIQSRQHHLVISDADHVGHASSNGL